MAVTNSRGSFYRGVNFIEVSIKRESNCNSKLIQVDADHSDFFHFI